MSVNMVEVLERLPFCDDFHRQDLELLAPMVKYQRFAADTTIIEQNTLNLDIFCLIKGEVAVYVDDNFVISFDSNGEIFGEMGVVGHTTSSAAVKAKTDVSMIVIDADKISQLNEPIHFRLQMSFYKACAAILARKLIATNAMAKAWKNKESVKSS
jgi:CRP-like cAMP-binding protein